MEAALNFFSLISLLVVILFVSIFVVIPIIWLLMPA